MQVLWISEDHAVLTFHRNNIASGATVALVGEAGGGDGWIASRPWKVHQLTVSIHKTTTAASNVLDIIAYQDGVAGTDETIKVQFDMSTGGGGDDTQRSTTILNSHTRYDNSTNFLIITGAIGASSRADAVNVNLDVEFFD